MTYRVSNAESYILSAIIYAGRDSFTGNELTSVLIEKFALPKTICRAKAFTYNKLQSLVKKGLLTKHRVPGIYQYEYVTTKTFQEYASRISNLQKVDVTRTSSAMLLNTQKPEKHTAPASNKLSSFLKKCETDLAQITGEQEVYAALLNELPGHETELRAQHDELNIRASRLMGKISALERIISQSKQSSPAG